MLHFSSVSHNAFQPTPHSGCAGSSCLEKEHRLLAFSNPTGGGAPLTPPETPQPTEGSELVERERQPRDEAQIQTQTRADAQHTLEGEGEQPEGQVNTAVSVLKGVEALKEKLLTTQKKAQALYQNYKDIMPSAMQNQVLKADMFLNVQLNKIERWIESINTIQAFRAGNVSPKKLADWLTTYIQNTGDRDPEQERWKNTVTSLNQRMTSRTAAHPLTAIAIDKMDGGGQWQTQNASTQLEIDQEIQAILKETQEIVPLDDLLALIDANRKTFESNVIQDGLQKMDEAMKGMEENLEKVKTEKTTPAQKKGLLDGLGIKFYSPLEIWEAFKMLKEAWTENFRQRTRLKAAGLAQSAGNVLQIVPFGKGINEILESQNDKANNEIKDGYVSFLKNGYTSFNALFAPGGEFDRNKHDVNRARAVLEYAASRGWLWDINDTNSSERLVAGEKLDNFLPSHWSEQRRGQYFMFLLGQNSSGGSKERQEGKSRVETAEEISGIIPEIVSEMRGRNFWAVLGMAEAAMAKGKLGEVSPWVAATIFNEMRKGDTLKYMPKDMIDQLGGLGLGHPGFTLQTFKTERKKWYEWRSKKQTGLDIPMEDINNFTRAFATVEQDFTHVQDEQERLRLIAKVLAGQVVEYKGKAYSIFDKKYRFYRDPMIKQTYEGEFDSKKADYDFFGEESEVILYGPKAIADLLTVSNQKFINATKATNTLRGILDRYDQLIAAGLTEDAKEYQHDMRIKFHDYLRSGTINDVRTEAIAEIKVTPKTTKQEEHIFAALITRGLIEQQELENIIKEHNAGQKKAGIATFKNILRQVDPNNPLLRGGGGGGGGGTAS